ncbi:MAG: hypothetical protein A3G32_07940 [Deltaproteobacteria bacterium RIFCSPLOWO2_12_FULL_40_28]|nr:MAG: hypothetical protein A3C45_00640 [Deltaproteobacteria bacterium RIFCSPHIGHO2_02_FULL_40_28]OGQ20842.1 MAG: hypothetical protein A3E27_03305 [Deltaproteobacteria bacterium RIFCSPHIGHO2_12_FULL_40_32]OGQ39243.1 MAG: hypothetical protein A3I69_04665 [Deltaproteobacteria bacterium RIFCSPLOWO2_02_FULL_40_36]OGQ54524.1 MAG: hypothetical protein A3G32_07940 [Deltaproteobacteria bacterium RIFCSPLOWO2_12_FULL_40_28]
MLYIAHDIVTITGPIFSPGFIEIEKERIVNLGSLNDLSAEKKRKAIDVSHLSIFPGFINAHSHLELTALGPVIPQCETNHPSFFTDWIRKLLLKKNSLSLEKIHQGIKKGIENLKKQGVVAIGDHISFNIDWAPVLHSGFKGKLFPEIIGVIPEIAKDILDRSLKKKKEHEKNSSKISIHPSPHSVHAVHPDVLDKIFRQNPPLSCHIAESESEFLYFSESGGSLVDLINEKNQPIKHHALSALDYLSKNKLDISRLTLVHGNYLTKTDHDLIKKNKLSLIHCPGSHRFFGHRPFPLFEYLQEGKIIALGTDSLASNTELNFLGELKLAQKTHPRVSLVSLITMATLHGAYALHLENQLGSLEINKSASLVGYRALSKDPFENPFLALQADLVLIDGQKI